MLFYSDGKKAMASVDDSPSGSDKGQIYSFITQLIFEGHPKYGSAYEQNQKKFCDTVSNCITNLRTKYKKLKAKFSDTGASVVPLGDMAMKNLLDTVLIELPWYTELDQIWHSNLSIAAKTHSSKLGADHAGTLYSLVQPHGRAGPAMHFDTSAQRSSVPTHDAQSSSNSQPYNVYTSHSVFPAATTYPPKASLAMDLHGDPAIDLQLRPAAPAPTLTLPQPQTHLPGLCNSPDVEIHDDFAPQCDNSHLESGPLDSLLGDALNHLDDDEIMCTEAVEPWGVTQSSARDCTQHVDAVINNTQHNICIVVGLYWVANPTDLTASQCRELKEEG
ncbi:hypothetical protein EV424DRAFT_1356273 [Suillus variegatus]|nr:hypothetical protein EV424DRAFT_1356273 [Suillus variegatus]